MKVEESLNVTFDESPPLTKLSPLVDDDVREEEAIENNTKVVNNNNEEDESIEVDEVVNIKESKNHPLEQVIWQTATGKESSNPFMAGSLPKTISPMIHISQEVILLKEERTVSKDSEVCKITRADGTSSFHGDFQALLRRLDRQDLFQLYSLVQERYKHRSIEGHDLDLWGDLKMMFDPNEEDDIWLNQHYWELLRWKLHEYSGVHSLFLDGTSIQINMLVDKKYPLKKEILKKMINLKIEAEEESDMASELIKFIKSQIAEQKEGNSFKPVAQITREADGTSTTTIPGAVIVEEKILKKQDLKS
ncbi:hypothetical protein Tco_0006512 [Tanacetum coccineum]